MNNPEISWHVHLSIKSGCLKEFRQLTDEMIQNAETEIGLIIFERFVNTEGTAAYVYERYADSLAAEVHLKVFAEKFGDRFSSLVERKSFIVLGDPSSDLRKLLDQFGASHYFAHFASFTRLH